MTILDEKDWNRLQSALERMESIEIERVYQPLNVRVVVNTSLVDKPWTVAMIVTVKAYFKGGEWHQHCESVEQAKRVLKEWNPVAHGNRRSSNQNAHNHYRPGQREERPFAQTHERQGGLHSSKGEISHGGICPIRR